MSETKNAYVVTNLDDGESYNVDEVTKKFHIVKLDDSRDERDGHFKEGEEEVEDDYYFDASQNSLSLGQTKADSTYQPLQLPEGGRLQFVRISAVGTTRDVDDKVYSVYYLDVRCNVSSPNSWFVYRRYSQFRRLSDTLRSEGYYVPVLPPKQILGTFSVDFVRQRKNDLETWLHNLMQTVNNLSGAKDPQFHPFFRKFLTEDANNPPKPLARIFPETSRDMNIVDSTLDSLRNSGQQKVVSDCFYIKCYLTLLYYTL